MGRIAIVKDYLFNPSPTANLVDGGKEKQSILNMYALLLDETYSPQIVSAVFILIKTIVWRAKYEKIKWRFFIF